MEYRIGIDLGGTNIAVGIVDQEYQIIARASTSTKRERSADEIITDIISVVEALLEEKNLSMEDIASIGLGVPGIANKDTKTIEFANNLSFEDIPIASILAHQFQKIVYFDNDGNAAAWGEYLAGVGKGTNSESLVAITLGTGVGGGLILNGEIYQGTNYGAAEIGHMVIDCHGLSCSCGREGCFEAYASATALIEQTKQAMNNNLKSVLWELCNHNIAEVDGKLLFEAVRLKDKTANEILENYIQYLAVGVINIINVFQPDILCIGGGISNAGDILLDPLNKIIRERVYTRNSAKQTQIFIAKLNNDAGIIGAAYLKK
jgi:glucokinase